MTRPLLLYTPDLILAAGFRLVAAEHFTVGVATRIDAVFEILKAAPPDLVLLDYSPAIDLFTMRRLKEASHSYLMLWAHAIPVELGFQAMEAGLRGIVDKSLCPEEQISRIESALNGELIYERELLLGMLTARRIVLARRESQLVRLIGQGLKNKEIGAALGITEGTVKVYLARLYDKLHVKDRYELAIYAAKNIGATNSPGVPLDAPPQIHSLMFADRHEKES